MRILHLPLLSKWYDMIESGVKKEEYREIKPYWYIRFFQRKQKYFYWGRLDKESAECACDPNLRKYLIEGFMADEVKPYTHVRFRNGYTKRTMLYELDGISVGKGNVDWGAPEDKEVFIIRFHKEK